ncbi:MAG: phenylacetate--CoA ligase family protein [Deltaproteobacteria bacterium]|nr:phenylacetate--CoA ligase family protein [Deltaproteobacteria bacterium]
MGFEGSAVARGSDLDRDRLIAEAVARARRSPFYSRHLAGAYVNGRADLAGLPLTFKEHLRDNGPYGMLIVPPHQVGHYRETTATVGEPISTWCGLGDVQRMGTIVHRMVPELSQPTMLVNRFPPSAPFSFALEEALRQARACHIAAGDGPFSRVLDFIKRLKVTALSGLPLEPILLRELARVEGYDMRRDLGSLKVIFCGGAILPPALKRVIEKDWDARVVEIYGSDETLLMGVGCTAGRMHLCHDLLELETVDPQTHEPVDPGEPGVLTVTSLVHEVMPLVRYFTGDLVRLSSQPCACGEPGATAEWLGRYGEALEYGGVRITPHELLDAAYDFADHLETRVFFIVVLKKGLRLLVEVDNPERCRGSAPERNLVNRLKIPVQVEYLRENDVLDRSAMFRGTKIYQPVQIADWRNDDRQPLTIMEALREWPKHDRRAVFQRLKRQVGSRLRRRRFLKEDER